MKHTDSDVSELSGGREVFLADDAPFEAPAKELVPGPFYMNVEEVEPELGEDATDQDGDSDSSGKLAVHRRDFMRLFSITTMAASASCVRRPVEKVIPYVDQPVDQVPGVSVNYATVADDGSGEGIIVKTREGRPVKVMGNGEHPLSQGGSSTYSQASLQALYHPDRRKKPMMRYGAGSIADVEWQDVFSGLADDLRSSKKIGILTRASTGHRIDFYKKFLQQVGADPRNLFALDNQSLRGNIAKAHQLAFGVEGIPRPDIRRTEFLVGVGSEFLDISLSSTYEAKGWAAGHAYDGGSMGEFVQFESRTTLTGSKATQRHVIAPGDELAVTMMLVEALLKHPSARGSKEEQNQMTEVVQSLAGIIAEAKTRLKFDGSLFTKLVEKLLVGDSVGRSLVIVGQSGANDATGTMVQLAGIMANTLIGSYERTTHFKRGWFKASDSVTSTKEFLERGKELDLLLVVDCNPAFTLPASSGIGDILAKIPTVASIQVLPTETDQFARYLLNGHHFLESWGDEETVAGFWSMRQPVVRPMGDSRQVEDILLWVLAALGKPLPYREYRDYLMEAWKEIHRSSGIKVNFDTFFQAVQRRGFVGKLASRTIPSMKPVKEAFKGAQGYSPGLKLVAHLDNRLFDGEGATLPILQEVGDSMTTIAWDTWVAISPVTAKAQGLKYNDLVVVKTSAGQFEAAIYPMPGLHPDTVAVPRGNGRGKGISLVCENIGVDPLVAVAAVFDPQSGLQTSMTPGVVLSKTGRKYRLAAMQKNNDIANRSDVVKTMKLEAAAANISKAKDLDTVPDIYPKLEEADHRWGMSIDLNKCTGCSACMVSCAIENNVPSVGRDQILMGREMHWLRIDRYFSGPVENPTVTFQPVMCQHCNHAPCEAVCPVYATTHDSEGMNSQTYNRCIGTRYCANACPYKVRRFNWWTHKWNVVGERPIDRNPRPMNPDVTVRTRGIMEKCSFCVQRIREAKHSAKKDGKDTVRDGDFKVACEEVCATDAIIFGNLKDKASRIHAKRKDNRAYLMLGGDPEHNHFGIKTLPNVSYLTKVEHDGSRPSGRGAGQGNSNPHGHGHGHHGNPHGSGHE